MIGNNVPDSDYQMPNASFMHQTGDFLKTTVPTYSSKKEARRQKNRKLTLNSLEEKEFPMVQ